MRVILVLWFVAICHISRAQAPLKEHNNFARKGNIYAYWGWNGSAYTHSNIHFSGSGYDFTLKNVKAKHRPTKLGFKEYLGVQNLTIPQYNFRVGYYFHHNWDLSFGVDHMKYVMVENQSVKMDGLITNSQTQYDGVHDDQEVILSPNFLTFEHTDGLNYLNIALRRSFNIHQTGRVRISGILGSGLGAFVPRSNIQLLGKTRHDAWHLSGWGLDLMAGAKLKYGKYFFVQMELKAGFVHLPSITTSYAKSDKASQSFGYLQDNILFGFEIPLIK